MVRPELRTEADVIVAGAGGAAGVFAMRKLQEAGISAIGLEARKRLGGRIHTTYSSGKTTELYAEFVHGDDGPTWEKIREFGLHAEAFPSAGGLAYNDGRFINGVDPERILMDLRRHAHAIVARGESDLSLAAFLALPEVERIIQASSVNRRLIDQLLKNDLAADPEHLSFRALLEPEVTGFHQSHRIVEGYGELIRRAAADLDIRMHHIVERINWDPQNVEIFTQQGAFRARYVIVTFPIGVLQAGDVVFDPELPCDYIDAIHAIGSGSAVKAILTFERNQMGTTFWPDAVPWIATGLDTQFYWQTDLGQSPRNYLRISNLTCGDAADRFRVAGKGEGNVALVPINQLAHMFDRSPAKLVRKLSHFHWSDASADPFSKTGYSALRAGADPQVRTTLAEPLIDTMFFAGEAVGTRDVASVAAAITSGERAAKRITALES